jgi:acetoacetate decarboxylase
MGFVKSFPEIMALAGRRAEFFGAKMLTVVWETGPEVVRRLLPAPLEPMDRPLALAFVADYPRTNFSRPYQEAALLLEARHQGVTGSYCLAMPVTDDMAMAGGREVFGFPKKMADVHFSLEGDEAEGWVERHGIRYFRARASLTGQPNDPDFWSIFPPADPADQPQERQAYNFKHFPSPEGQGFDGNPRLVRQTTLFKPEVIRIGRADMELTPSDFDPWAEVEVVRLLGAIYTQGHNTMLPGKIVAEVDPIQFGPHAFLKWDIFSEQH